MTDELEAVFHLNFSEIIVGIFAILVLLKGMIELVTWLGTKMGIQFKWVEAKNADHKLLLKNSEEIESIKKLQAEDAVSTVDSVLKYDRRITEVTEKLEDLTNMVTEINETLKNINKVSEANSAANIELLYQKINEKCDHYINDLNGIPNEESAVLQNLFDKYDSLGGNHGLKRKVEYCLEKLPILPDKQL